MALTTGEPSNHSIATTRGDQHERVLTRGRYAEVRRHRFSHRMRAETMDMKTNGRTFALTFVALEEHVRR